MRAFRSRRRLTFAAALSLSIAGLAALPPTADAAGTTLFVAQGGNDSNSCTTPATSCASVARALGLVETNPSVTTIDVSGTVTGAADADVARAITVAGVAPPAGSPAPAGAAPVIAATSGSRTLGLIAAPPGTDPAVTLRNLTIQGGSELVDGSAFSGDGGDIEAITVKLTVIDSTISTGFGNNEGGGIYLDGGSLSLSDSLVTGNQANGGSGGADSGGGIYAFASTVTVTDSTISNNLSSNLGGGIAVESGSLTVTGSTINNNTAPNGGGVGVTDSDVTIVDSTIADNTADDGGATGLGGGGLYLDGAGIDGKGNFVADSTVAGNSSSSGAGGIEAVDFAEATIAGTILADNGTSANSDCDSFAPTDVVSIISERWNLIDTREDLPCGEPTAFDDFGDNPQLGPLQDNGGPTQTMVPASTGPAAKVIAPDQALPIGGGAEIPVCSAGMADQRGVAKPLTSGGQCTIGAVEVDSPGVITATGTARSATVGTALSNVQTASFVSNVATTPASFSATIAWGDGTTSTGTIRTVAGVRVPSLIVTGSHTYAKNGTLTITTTITESPSNVVGKATATATVAKGTLTTATPVITGTAKVGDTLTAVPGAWTSGTAFSYQWLANGVKISGATAKTLALTGSQAGKRISVAVTGSKTGYNSATRTSAATAAVAKGTLTAGTPKITGTVRVGGKLAASPGGWTTGTTLTYRWFAGGTAVSGATAKTFTVRAAQVGKKITVKVTGTKAGYTSATKTSAATAAVKPA